MVLPQPAGPPPTGPPPTSPQPDDGTGPICSARACRAIGVWALRWNNPGLHPPDRRKTWLACEEHRSALSDFLSRRGFLRELVGVDAPAGEAPGGEAPSSGSADRS